MFLLKIKDDNLICQTVGDTLMTIQHAMTAYGVDV
jgi:hypothetical protein